jgi:hypothetical protein
MARGKSNSLVFFTCLNCKALYQLLKVEAGAVDRAETCLVCGAPLPSRAGEFDLNTNTTRRLSSLLSFFGSCVLYEAVLAAVIGVVPPMRHLAMQALTPAFFS